MSSAYEDLDKYILDNDLDKCDFMIKKIDSEENKRLVDVIKDINDVSLFIRQLSNLQKHRFQKMRVYLQSVMREFDDDTKSTREDVAEVVDNHTDIAERKCSNINLLVATATNEEIILKKEDGYLDNLLGIGVNEQQQSEYAATKSSMSKEALEASLYQSTPLKSIHKSFANESELSASELTSVRKSVSFNLGRSRMGVRHSFGEDSSRNSDFNTPVPGPCTPSEPPIFSPLETGELSGLHPSYIDSTTAVQDDFESKEEEKERHDLSGRVGLAGPSTRAALQFAKGASVIDHNQSDYFVYGDEESGVLEAAMLFRRDLNSITNDKFPSPSSLTMLERLAVDDTYDTGRC